jgi:hypothetical protein
MIEKESKVKAQRVNPLELLWLTYLLRPVWRVGKLGAEVNRMHWQ